MSKTVFYLVVALLLITACKQDDRFESKSETIHISTSINGVTRTSKTEFTKGDAISVYAYETGEIEKLIINNSINTYDGAVWSAEPKMTWSDESRNYDFLAVYPSRRITDFTATSFALDKEVIKNDLLVATNKNVTSDKAPRILLNFSHVMSKVTINLDRNSSLATEPKIERVVLKSKSEGLINFVTKEITATGVAADIKLERVGDKHYIGITVPQTIEAKTQLILIYVEGGDKPYVYTTATAIELNTNKHTTLNLTLGADNVIELKNTTINPWGESDEVDGETGGNENQIEPGPWGDADDGTIAPDLAETITLNTQKYDIPEKSELDFANKTLSISHRGGVAEIEFNGKYDKNLTVLTSDPRLTIVSSDQVKYKNHRLIITATQPEEGREYAVKFRIAHPLFPSTKFMDMTVKVMSNIIPSVIIGQLEWMAYNGCGRAKELYPPLEVNQTVREVYQENWKKYSANCMWGERVPNVKPLIFPWEVVRALNSGGTNIGSGVGSWPNGSSSIPCPDGWRVPTKDEINVFWPNHNTVAVGQYTKSGVTYRTSIEDSGAPDIFVNATTTISPKIYVISFGEKELIFPMTGWRQRDDYANGQALPAINAGKEFYLWTQAKGSAVWAAYIVGVTSGNKSFNVASGNQEAFTEAYNGVRCVRNVK